MSHKFITDALSQLIMRKTLTEINNWVTHLSAVLFADWITIKKYRNEFILNNL